MVFVGVEGRVEDGAESSMYSQMGRGLFNNFTPWDVVSSYFFLLLGNEIGWEITS